MQEWLRGFHRMFRLKVPDTRPDDEKAEADKIARAKMRLRMLDLQADIIMRRAGKAHEPR